MKRAIGLTIAILLMLTARDEATSLPAPPETSSIQTAQRAVEEDSIEQYPNLRAAIAAIGATPRSLTISNAQSVSSSLVIPANVALRITGGGRFDLSPGVALTINGPFEAPLRQVFGGGGVVRWGGGIEKAYTEWWGGKGDNSTDNGAAIDAAQLSFLNAPGILQFLSGTYLFSANPTTLKASNVKWVGAGMYLTRFRRASGHLFVDSAATPVENIIFEDLGFEADNSGSFPFNLVGHVRGIRWSRCRFWKFGQLGGMGYGIHAASISNAIVEDSIFHNPGNAAGVGVTFQNGSSNIEIRRNRFLYCGGAFVAADSTGRMEHITFEGNHSDAAWPYLVATAEGSGGQVSYSATVLTNARAAFGSLTAGNQVRVLPIKTSGSGTNLFTRTTLSDSKAPFSSVREGDIVRSGAAFAIVSAKQSDRVLNLEEWLSDTDRLPVGPPADGVPYTVYRLLLGNIVSNTNNSVTVGRWFDIDGNSVTPVAGTRYELLYPRPTHAVTIEAGCRDVKIRNNTILRSGADQIMATASEQSIEGNYISHGWDMGITLWNDQNKVQGNTIKHQGVGGIWTNGDDNLIQGNQIFDSRWINNGTTPLGGDITVQGGNRNRVQGNFCNRLISVNAHFGILIAADGASVSGNVVTNNTSLNHISEDITIYAVRATASDTKVESNTTGVIGQWSASGATITGSRFWLNKARAFNYTTGYYTGAYSNAQFRDNEFGSFAIAGGTRVSGTDYGVQRGSGSPEGVVYGSIGDIFRRSNGGAGTAFCVKETGNDTNTGWVCK